MKVNVNEYNEILNYEGTPAEIAELIKLGVFGEWVPVEEMVDCGYDEEYEDCGCEDVPEVSDDLPVEPTITEPESEEAISEIELPDIYDYNSEECKTYVKQQIKLLYPGLSDEDFEKYYAIVVNWVNDLSKLDS